MILQRPPGKARWTAKLARAILANPRRLQAFLRQRFRGPHQEVDDLAQEVHIRLLGITDSRIENWAGYIVGVAANVLRDQWRMRARQQQVPLDDVPTDQWHATSNPEDEIATREQISRALAELDPKERCVMEHVYFDDMTSKEIANLYEINVGQVQELRKRALLKLRSMQWDR